MLSRKISLLKRVLFVPNATTTRTIYNRDKIGSREWVGWGANGQALYVDSFHFPFPSVRFRENTNELIALKEKEKGDWRKLSCEEKKCLYRASFCQTFAEMDAPTGEWKSILGIGIFLTSMAVWMIIALKLFIFGPLPPSMSQEAREAQLRRSIDLMDNPVTGISSKWDYENDDWKKNVK